MTNVQDQKANCMAYTSFEKYYILITYFQKKNMRVDCAVHMPNIENSTKLHIQN